MASDLEIKAKDAFIDDHFELAVNLYTQAIELNPKHAELYANRSQANIKLNNFAEAVADANRAIELDPSMPKAFLRKGTACMKLEEYQTAREALETGASLAPGESRFSNLIKECEERITVADVASQRPTYSSSKTKMVDWDKLEAQVKKEEKEEKLDGDAALNKFFREIYQDADEDTRRAMQKSFVESNGTVLSTDWKEVGLKKVEGVPPDGMEMRKWEY